MHTDAAKEAIRVFILDAFGEMPCRVCLEKVFDPPVYTVTKWVKSPGHGPLLVRSHRFCPLFCRWGRWIYQPPELRSFLSMFSCDVTICFLIFAWILCAKFEIRKDDVRVTTISFWNFAAFASSVKNTIQKINITKESAEIWHGFNEEVRRIWGGASSGDF